MITIARSSMHTHEVKTIDSEKCCKERRDRSMRAFDFAATHS